MALRVMMVSIHCLCLFQLLIAALLTSAFAQVKTMITPDGSLGTKVNQNGPVHTIDDGAIRGPNLFHSFDRFDVGAGDMARFTGPASVENILSRVTGGLQSMIDGGLQSDIPGANLYLLNPSGVMFGPNARLDITGSFYISTADVLRLGTDGAFHASLDEQSMLSVSVPSAFGFLQDDPAGIRIEGTSLAVPTSQALSVIGGDIHIGEHLALRSSATLVAPSGQLHLVSVASPANVSLLPTDAERHLTVNGFTRLGAVTIRGSALVDVSSSDGAGIVFIRGGRLFVDNALIFADTTGEQGVDSIGIDIRVEKDLILTNGAFITTDALASGNAGDIRVTAGKVELLNGAVIASRTFAQGNAGRVEVEAGELRIDESGTDQFTGIVSNASPDSSGEAGTVTVTVQGLVELINGAEVASNTFAQGNAGRVEVAAGELRIIGLGTPNQFTGIASSADQGSLGNAGMVTVTVQGTVELINGASISSSTFAQGNAGSVEVAASELRINGLGTPDQFTGIVSSANSDSSGSAGTVTVAVQGLVELRNGASISSSTFAQGNAGSVKVAAGELHIDESGTDQFTGIVSNASQGSSGAAGTVTVTVQGLVELRNGAEIASNTFAKGNAGSVEVAAGELRIDDMGTDQLTGIVSNANRGSSGSAGTVTVTVQGLVELLNGAEISSNTFAQGNAGSVDVVAGELRIDDLDTPDQFTGIASGASRGSSGSAGTVTVTVQDLVELLNGAEISSSTFAQGNAGSVEVVAGELRIDGGRTNQGTGIASLATLNASGSVGNVEVVVGTATLLNGGAISIEARQILPESQITERTEARILIRADHLLMDGEANITAESTGNVPASAIEILAGTLVIEGNSRISTQSSAGARGGDIQVTAQSAVRLRASTITAEVSLAGGSGIGGDIDIDADAIELMDGARIIAESRGTGDAGNMRIHARQTLLIDQSEVNMSAVLSDGGDINVTAEFARLRDGQLTTAVGRGDGSGGNITVNTNLGLLERSEISADAFGGPGGNITILADGFVTDVDSTVTASSQLSVDGTVSIQGLADLSGSLTPIDSAFASATALQSDPCFSRLQGEGIGRFTLAGRNRHPTEPGGWLPSPSGKVAIAAVIPPARRQAALLSPGQPRLASSHNRWHRDCVR